jgi:FtsH-binding integral membrane protein
MFVSRSSSNFNLKEVLNFDDLSSSEKKHLMKVYATMAATIALSAVGTYVAMMLQLNMNLMVLLAFIPLIALLFVPKDKMSVRYGLLFAFGFFKGASLAPLIEYALDVHPEVVTMAFMATCLVFVSFSLSALLSQKRSWLFLGGILSSSISVLFYLGIARMFFGGTTIPYIQLYGGLIVFCFYILYDTQLIVEKCRIGSNDHITHALDLYIDFIAIFIRILIIMLKNKEKKRERK